MAAYYGTNKPRYAAGFDVSGDITWDDDELGPVVESADGTAYILQASDNGRPLVNTSAARTEIIDQFAIYKIIWEWNGTDLTQFATKVDGSDVQSSTTSVASWNGFNWVSISTTSVNPLVTDTVRSCCTALPIDISGLTSSADYGIMAEVVNRTKSGVYLGGGIAVRFNTSSDGYDLRLVDAGTKTINFHEAGAAEAANIDAQAGYARGAILNQSSGNTLVIEQEGRMSKLGFMAMDHLVIDGGNQTSAQNKPALFSTTKGAAAGGTVVNYFRNIKVFLT